MSISSMAGLGVTACRRCGQAQAARAHQLIGAQQVDQGAEAAPDMDQAREGEDQEDAHAQEHVRSEEHTSELQSPCNLVCRLLLEKKKRPKQPTRTDLTLPPS